MVPKIGQRRPCPWCPCPEKHPGIPRSLCHSPGQFRCWPLSPLHSSLREALQPVEALSARNCYCSRFQPWPSPVSCPVLASSSLASRALCTYVPTGVEGEAAPVQHKSSKCRSLPQVIHLLRLSFTATLASLS